MPVHILKAIACWGLTMVKYTRLEQRKEVWGLLPVAFAKPTFQNNILISYRHALYKVG